MKREYNDGTSENVTFFTGIEVEKTPAYGKKTLFVTGLQDGSIIRRHLDDTIEHIFFGANHSFNPASEGYSADYFAEWEKMIEDFIERGYLCTLDIPINTGEEFLEGPLVEYDLFIPQIRVPLPYIRQWNYNTMIKLDDKGFEDSNPGVWCHSLHDLQDRTKFTDWQEYKNDKVVE